MESLKDLTQMVYEKTPLLKGCFFKNKVACQLCPLNMYALQKRIHIHDLLDIFNNPMKFQLNKMNNKNSVKTV